MIERTKVSFPSRLSKEFSSDTFEDLEIDKKAREKLDTNIFEKETTNHASKITNLPPFSVRSDSSSFGSSPGYFPNPVATTLLTESLNDKSFSKLMPLKLNSIATLKPNDSEIVNSLVSDKTAGCKIKVFGGEVKKRFRFPQYITHIQLADSKDETSMKKKKTAEFGLIESPKHKCVSKYPEGYGMLPPLAEEPPYQVIIATYLSFLMLICFGHIRDFLGKRFRKESYSRLRTQDGFAPLYSDFDSFYIRRLKLRINDCFHRPVTGVPGRMIHLIDRESHDFNITYEYPGTVTKCLNMSSYNYLGFAQSEGFVTSAVQETIRKFGLSSCQSRLSGGTLDLHLEVEDLVASFLGTESASIYSQGFGTNATIFSALVSKGCLLISDELNHASIRFGARLSNSNIRVFKHNDMQALEKLLRDCISQGQPRTHRPWRKILVVVEGLYSMEGDLCNLRELVRLRKRYKFYLFIDEAHSIGALGPNSKGVCDYFGVDPKNVDVLMGTFTKSFGAAGGYIAGDKNMIKKLQLLNAGTVYSESVSPLILEQIRSALLAILGKIGDGEGKERVQRLTFNIRYLRLGLKRLGFIVYGQDDSPVIPVLIFHPGKMNAFSHEMLRRNIAVVVVSYPATSLLTSRVRFCVSAAHTKSDLDRLLSACNEIGDIMGLKTSTGVAGDCIGPKMLDWAFNGGKDMYTCKGKPKPMPPPRWSLEKVLECGEDDVQY